MERGGDQDNKLKYFFRDFEEFDSLFTRRQQGNLSCISRCVFSILLLCLLSTAKYIWAKVLDESMAMICPL
jgi:hypothetical protein